MSVVTWPSLSNKRISLSACSITQCLCMSPRRDIWGLWNATESKQGESASPNALRGTAALEYLLLYSFLALLTPPKQHWTPLLSGPPIDQAQDHDSHSHTSRIICLCPRRAHPLFVTSYGTRQCLAASTRLLVSQQPNLPLFTSIQGYTTTERSPKLCSSPIFSKFILTSRAQCAVARARLRGQAANLGNPSQSLSSHASCLGDKTPFARCWTSRYPASISVAATCNGHRLASNSTQLRGCR